MLEKIKSPNETILWYGKPKAFPYVIGSPFFYVFAFFWGAFDFFFIKLFLAGGIASETANEPFQTVPFKYILIIFFAAHLTPVWIAIFMPFVRMIAVKNIEYMVTDLRVYLVSGIFGKDITNIEYREIKDLTVNVNPIEHFCRCGTIVLTPDRSSSSRSGSSTRGRRILHVSEPYDLYNTIKQLSLDVTTDQQFPNAYRPEENPGYQTRQK